MTTYPDWIPAHNLPKDDDEKLLQVDSPRAYMHIIAKFDFDKQLWVFPDGSHFPEDIKVLYWMDLPPLMVN